MISILLYENMHYNRSRFAGKTVDEQTRHSASPLLGLNYLFRRSLIQLDRSAIQYSSVYNHIYNCPVDSIFVMYRGLIICTRVTGTNLEHNCTRKEFRCEFRDCVQLCVSHPAIQHAAESVQICGEISRWYRWADSTPIIPIIGTIQALTDSATAAVDKSTI